MTESIVAWLLEQVAEDERAIESWDGACVHIEACDSGWEDFSERYTADRLRAECAAKRKIIALHSRTGSLRDPREHAPTYDYSVDICSECRSEWPFGRLPGGGWGHLDVWTDELGHPTLWPCTTLRLLALLYADRPGYREEWRL